MKLFDRSDVARPASVVWPYVITAEHFRRWNDKIVDMEASGPFHIGQTFHTSYRMSGKEIHCWSTVTALEEDRLLELRHENCTGIHRDSEITERITLAEKHGRTVVTKEVTIRNSGVPWFFAALIWFINRFGKPVQPNKLKALCEGDTL